MKRADAARTNLLRWFDSELHKTMLDEEDETYVRTFREACDVQIAELDLASFASVVKFATGIQQKYVNFVFYPRLLSTYCVVFEVKWLLCSMVYLATMSLGLSHSLSRSVPFLSQPCSSI